ncbi:LIM and senescent cell antigen-like-containing domain protein 1 isoform X1 [Paramacrobiotus metropolitanus]|uniref:LIM and senescent cell antigen-like-containing domain protein 1 isoform X1 n=1 Tax=Paramacrobiotus metropolitanus TaxID=2943436 RepID=UPI00244657C0|nr:LIM and senescent cell antigen-like-containing domain protein 1 isoform X1 [Paramacrobiotus metropolitanus]
MNGVLTSHNHNYVVSNGTVCQTCREGFDANEPILNSQGESYHEECLVCAQCFRPFVDGVYYEFEGRKYCEHDFQVLYAPCCAKCNEFIIGRVIKAMYTSWHPEHFQCEICGRILSDIGFMRNQGRALCHPCNDRVRAEAAGKYICYRCRAVIDDKPLKYKNEPYHPYHFNCSNPECGRELDSDAREIRGELYCLRCHDKMGIPICGACRRPVEDRVVTALGKHWHVEHFVCAKCEKPFLGTKHFERKGLAYCELHYHQLFGNIDFVSGEVIEDICVSALNKTWKPENFVCWSCETPLDDRTKFFEFDMLPVCKKCYNHFPGELRRRLTKHYEAAKRIRPILPASSASSVEEQHMVQAACFPRMCLP